jgi:diguanylate cyclase (GGDEF)-like protein/putative nucleotidyltransferase with HDIG domain
VKLQISTTTRIALSLTGLSVGCLLVVLYLGMIPDAVQTESEGRCALAESVAVQCCLAAQHDDIKSMQAVLGELVVRNDSILSAAVRRRNGDIASEAGDHRAHWQASSKNLRPGAQLKVPIYQGHELWGALEVRCRPLGYNGWLGWLMNPATRLIISLSACGFLVHRLYLKRVLRLLDPTAVVSDRVRATLETLAEGVVILDNKQQIVLANKAFADALKGQNPDALQDVMPSEFGWSNPIGEGTSDTLPWVDAIRRGVARTGVVLRLPGTGDRLRTLSVNALPIVGVRGERRGALATFDDVTTTEQQNIELARMLATLKESRDEIQRQNRELYQLATFDPLTRCLNRRSFFEKLKTHWTSAIRDHHPISFVMVDIDHFKSVNDRFGHSTGDMVLQMIGETLRTSTRDSDLVCRYGGEEFCILLPHMDIAQAVLAAERYRAAIEAMPFEQFSITASFGVAAFSGREATSQELLELADKALYAAKHDGRNRIGRGDQISENDQAKQPATPTTTVATPTGTARATHAPVEKTFHQGKGYQTPVTVNVVCTLSCALAYRDTMTAEHSRQVAEMCMLAARDLLSQHECHELEIAALLHDIGKLAVPDAILLKPGSLTEDEWAVMRAHDRIGAEILEAACASPSLIEVVRVHHAWYAGNTQNPELPRGENIPLAARILSVADAFTAIIADRHYRKARSREEAFEELRRGAGTQFDPALVEHFIQVVAENDQRRLTPVSDLGKQTILDIGLQIERLAVALDIRDFTSLSTMSGHLAATAARGGAVEIAELAIRLESSAASEPDLMSIIQLTRELLDVCRSTQRAYLGKTGKLLLGGRKRLEHSDL